MIINKKYILKTTGELSTLSKISQLKEIAIVRVKDCLVGIRFYEKCDSENSINEYDNYMKSILSYMAKIPGVLKIEEYIETDIYKKYHISHPSDNFSKLCGLDTKWGQGIYFGDAIGYAVRDLNDLCPVCLDKFCEMADSLSIHYGDTVKINRIAQIDDKCEGWDELNSHLGKESIIEDIEIIKAFQVDRRESPEELFVFKLKGIENELWCIDELDLIKSADNFIGMKEFINKVSEDII